ncbi:unnamed protein product [Oppiella nova]|uniref:adenylate cyclase n=1 Tax=Oppiella nova TaxID=334625 RepID=A0A7R9QI18_9ACAR|nr:unnamed protein product [Oppiella nova]CAG2166236.1 unnamed protein product [Oppiella nova]
MVQSFPKPIATLSHAVQEKAWIRLVIAGSMIAVWITAHILTNVFSNDSGVFDSVDSVIFQVFYQNDSFNPYNMNRSMQMSRSQQPSQSLETFNYSDDYYPLPQYLCYFSQLSVTALTRISYLVKMFIILTLVIGQCCLNVFKLDQFFKFYDLTAYDDRRHFLGHESYLSIIIATIAIALFIINRQSELMSRRLFLWQKEVEEQKEKVSDMRRKNEALVYNILPPHVAIHFLGKRKNDEELYSKSYESVGILFAAMPNFSDFYTEESVNNQGLECIRLFYDLTAYDDRRHFLGHESYLSIIIATIAIALFIINRQSELMSRRLFLWQKEVEEQKEKVSDMRRKNEALVYNILPPHVAIHFLGKRKNDEELYSKSYESVGILFAAMPNFSDFYTEESVNNQGLECIRFELYSKSYESVGILFAAMPNFSDFYTEESVNNQGLECIRFLNEVISDYDALLEQPRFANIIKIKTISSTYMAASGLNCEESLRADASIKERWFHLAQLTEFALTLKDTLNVINKESFNNFVLRMGINHGPITAGVIGARKPHYDMWGNSVNVASSHLSGEVRH